jgi:hypothetical protein
MFSKHSDYFLSSVNPIATADQRDAERLAQLIAESSIGKQAVDRVSFLWCKAFGVDGARPEAWAMFDDAMIEYARNYILKAIASDPVQPRIIQNFSPPHRWFDLDIPGSRMGGDNPDNIYRMVGIQHGRRYILHGYQTGVSPAHVSFSLVSNWGTSKTVTSLESSELTYDEDGSFRIYIGPERIDNQPNQLITRPNVKLLFIRDSMMNWAIETPNAYQLEVLDMAPGSGLDVEDLAHKAADIMADDVPLYYWFTRLASGLRTNQFEPVRLSAASGGLPTQAGTLANFQLADDDAVVITIDPAGAAYCGIVAHDWYFRTINADRRTSSLTSAMSRPNPDGTITLVMSIADPGTYNWIDVGGLHDLLLFCRWQGLPKQTIGKGPKLRAEITKLSMLPDILLFATEFVTGQEREQQITTRAFAYDRRWANDK